MLDCLMGATINIAYGYWQTVGLATIGVRTVKMVAENAVKHGGMLARDLWNAVPGKDLIDKITKENK